MTLRGEEFRIDGQLVDPSIGGSITSAGGGGAMLIRRMDAATSLELTVSDPNMALLLSGALSRPGQPSAKQDGLHAAAWSRFGAARLELDGVSFRFAGSEGRYDVAPFTHVLTFEDELATLMRVQTAALKVSRGQDTRAEFIGRLATVAVRRASVPFSRTGRFFSPQAGQKQTIKAPSTKGRVKGISPNKHLTVKGAPMDAEQRKNAEAALRVADALRAGERATLALLDAVIVESQLRNLTGGTGSSSGILQVTSQTALGITPQTVIDPRTGQGHGAVTNDATGPIAPGRLNPRDIAAVVRVFLLKGYYGKGGAIQYAQQNPQAQIWEIAQAVQGSGAGAASNGQSNYGPWANEAKAILDAWGGAGSLQTIFEQYAFRAGGKRNNVTQNYWDDSGNLAQEVNWRRFADLNVLWFVADDWLFGRQPVFFVDGKDGPAGLARQGVLGGPAYQVDVGRVVSEIRLTARMGRWDGPPGAVVELDNMGPLTGRWLIWENRLDLAAPVETAVLTLRRPSPKLSEPATTTSTSQVTEARPESGTIRASIVDNARKALRLKSTYVYEQIRPMPATLFPAGAGPFLLHIDCSVFTTLIYKAAGAPDPNGSNFDGSGNTATQLANGHKTNDPQPGDICLYGSGASGSASHVTIYIGGGRCIGIGGSAGVLETPVTGAGAPRGDFTCYLTFDGVK